MVPWERALLARTRRPRSGVAVRVRAISRCGHCPSVGVHIKKSHTVDFNFIPMDLEPLDDHKVEEEEIHEDTSEREAEASGGSDGDVGKEEEVEEGNPGEELVTRCCVCGDDETEEDNPLLLCDGVCGMGAYYWP